MTNRRTRRSARPNKGAVRLAYAMWGVLGLMVLILGALMGVAWVRETGGPEAPAERSARRDTEPAVQPKPGLTRPPEAPVPGTLPEVKPPEIRTPGPSRTQETPGKGGRAEEAGGSKPKPGTPKPGTPGPGTPGPGTPGPGTPGPGTPEPGITQPGAPGSAKPQPAIPEPPPPTPLTFEDAGGSEAEQRAMLDRHRAAVTRAEKLIADGGLTSGERERVSGLLAKGKRMLTARNVAFDTRRWHEVMEHSRAKDKNTGELVAELDLIEQRLRGEGVATPKAGQATPPPKLPAAVQEIHDLLAAADRERELAGAVKSAGAAAKVLSGTLEKAASSCKRLQGDDLVHRPGLEMFLCNSRGHCKELLADFTDHRKPQEQAQRRATAYGVALREYERTLEIDGDAKYDTGISAKAWALHRIAVLAARIANHHEGRKKSYLKMGKVTYPQQSLIIKYGRKYHESLLRLKSEYPDARDRSGRSLADVKPDGS